MAEVVDKVPGGGWKYGREEIYDWDEWFDGRIWKLTPGVDFTTPRESFRSAISHAARRRGLTVITRFRRGGLYVKRVDASQATTKWKKAIAFMEATKVATASCVP